MFPIIIVVMDSVWIPDGHMSSIYGTHYLRESAHLEKFPSPRCVFVRLWPPDIPIVGERTHDYYKGEVVFHLGDGVIFNFSLAYFLTYLTFFFHLFLFTIFFNGGGQCRLLFIEYLWVEVIIWT